MNATPTVAPVVHELPVEREAIQQIRQTVNKNILGFKIFSP